MLCMMQDVNADGMHAGCMNSTRITKQHSINELNHNLANSFQLGREPRRLSAPEHCNRAPHMCHSVAVKAWVSGSGSASAAVSVASALLSVLASCMGITA
jgi:hypothetical protein